MREKYEDVVMINGISTDVLGKVLDFIYSGSISVTSDSVCDLLEGAEYTQIGGTLSCLSRVTGVSVAEKVTCHFRKHWSPLTVNTKLNGFCHKKFTWLS